jgi:outer membrane immunogenic protein
MMLMRVALIAAVAAATVLAGAAEAQTVTTGFRGFRAEGQVGVDRFQSQGEHNDKFGYGAEIGFDGTINDRIVVGPTANFWRANEWNQNVTSGVNGGSVAHKSFEEWSVGARAGYLVTPKLLAYAKGGYTVNEQRKRFDAPAGETSYYNRGNTTGYQVGGGVEYSLTDMFYVNGQYTYSGYSDNTARQRAVLGLGVRFK